LSNIFDRCSITLATGLCLILEDEQQTGICKVRAWLDVFTARGFAQITSARAPGGVPTGKAAAREFQRTTGPFVYSGATCTAFEEDAAWLLALREGRWRSKRALTAQRLETLKLLVWTLVPA